MARRSGDEFTVLDLQSLAASTIDDYYFPLGRREAGTADIGGIYRNAVIKELIVYGTDTYIHVQGLAAHHQDGSINWFLGNGTGDTDFAPGTTASKGTHFLMHTRVQDVCNMILRIENSHADTAKVIQAVLRYEPLR